MRSVGSESLNTRPLEGGVCGGKCICSTTGPSRGWLRRLLCCALKVGLWSATLAADFKRRFVIEYDWLRSADVLSRSFVVSSIIDREGRIRPYTLVSSGKAASCCYEKPRLVKQLIS